MGNKQRFLYIDLIRVVSAGAIVMIHTTTLYLENNTIGKNFSWIVALALNSICRWGTLSFIMISGALLIGSVKNNDLWGFYKKRLTRVVLPLFFWSIVYYFIGMKDYGYKGSVEEFLEMNWNGGTFYHLYFMYLILGLYLITPLLQWMIERLSRKGKYLVVAGLSLFTFADFLIRFYTNNVNSNVIFSLFLPYITFYLLGYLLKGKTVPDVFGKFLKWIVAVLFTVTFLGSYYLVSRNGFGYDSQFFLYRLNLNNTIIAIGIFLLFGRMNLEKIFSNGFEAVKKVTNLTNFTMGIYLVHPAILEIVGKKQMINNGVVNLAVTYLITIILSFGLIYLIKKVPILNKII